MKNTFLIFVSIFFVFTVGIQAKTRIVEKPSYVYSSTTMLEIPRVTLTDTATIVDFDVYYRAGKTVKFSSTLSLVDGNGCRYAFRWCEGYDTRKAGTYARERQIIVIARFRTITSENPFV